MIVNPLRNVYGSRTRSEERLFTIVPFEVIVQELVYGEGDNWRKVFIRRDNGLYFSFFVPILWLNYFVPKSIDESPPNLSTWVPENSNDHKESFPLRLLELSVAKRLTHDSVRGPFQIFPTTKTHSNNLPVLVPQVPSLLDFVYELRYWVSSILKGKLCDIW